MKKAKILSLLLAGSLLFNTAGIDALATAASEPVLAEQSVEAPDDESSEENTGAETSEQPSEEETGKESEEEQKPEQPSETEEGKDEESGKAETPEQPSEEEGENEEPSEETGESDVDDASLDETGDSEDSVSENTISENTLPKEDPQEEDSEKEDVFAIFPGLGDSYTMSSAQMADKRVLAAHVSDILSTYDRNADKYPDADGIYKLGEVVYLAETAEEAEQVAAAFGGDVDSYSYGVAVISLPKKATVTMAVAAASEPDMKLPAVWPNYYQYLTSDVNEVMAVSGPSDPGLDKQWQHDYIGTKYAWAAGYKGQDVKVAVIDSGLQEDHDDLSKNAIAGRDFVDNANGTAKNNDNGRHGTHVAGIIAADDNGIGGVGIAPDAQVRGYCVFPPGEDTGANSADVMRAITAAVQDENDIINMSLGGEWYDAQYEKKITDAYKAGVAVFVASGNDDTNAYRYPAAYSGAISVAAVDQNGARAAFSNYGGTVKLSFPGMYIYSTLPSDYGYMNGTSQASPAAAGTAAVILSADKSIQAKTGKAKVDALLAKMKSSTTKSSSPGMGAGTTWLPGALKIASDMTAPDAPVITIQDTPKTGTTYEAESVTATLSTKTAVGVEIWYTTDGKNPTYKNGAVTIGNQYTEGTSITLTGAKKVTIKAIALNPITGKVSKVASKACTLAPIPTGVTLTSKTGISRVAPGKSLALAAAVTPGYAVSTKVQWSVDDAATKAGVSVSNGTVKTKSITPSGTYTIKATAVGADGSTFNGVAGTYDVQVIAGATISKIVFQDENEKTVKPQTLDMGKTLDLRPFLKVTTQDGSAADANDVIWSSSNSKVATVTNGVITTVAPGKAVIKAISNDGFNKSASCNVTVIQPVTEITLSGPQKVAVGKAITLKATVTPANATNKKLTWKVEGNDKVTVTNGKVNAKAGASGTCTVIATAADSSKVSSAAYTVTIVSGEITKITLSAKNMVLFSKKASATTPLTGKLTATVEGKTGVETSLIEWTSSAPSIASVDQSGNVTAKAPGKATITCAATDGSNKKAACTVKVNVPMSKLSIGTKDSYGACDSNSGEYIGYIAQGKSIKMSAKCSSNYGTPADKKVTWSSSNPNILTVDKNGKVTAKSDAAWYAEAVITATAADGSGVTSNQYTFMVTPRFNNLTLTHLRGTYQDFYAVDMSGKTPDGKDMYASMPYFTVAVSGGKNVAFYKEYDDEDRCHYLSLVPIKATTTKPVSAQLTTKDAVKVTMTVTLRDGSNLKANVTCYVVRYQNGQVRYLYKK